MALPAFNMRQLLEAGVHFGHQTHRWNPKMAPFIFGARNNIHIIDLAQTVPMLHQALVTVSETVAKGGRVLFVGTKRQASDLIAEAAKRSAQYYINHRWLGGTLTNWKTISNSIRRLRELEELFSGETQGLTKKELLQLTREREKLERALGGIKDMGGVPDVVFVVDTNKESIAVAEARKLNIPVIAVVDTNCDPDDVSHPIPGNDDAGRAITLYCDLMAKAVIDGIERAQGSAGIDVGEAVEPAPESLAETGKAKQAESKTPKEEKPAKKDAKKAPKAEKAKDAKQDKAEPEKAKPKKAESKAGDSFKLLKKAEGEPDDLKQIGGVGPVLEKKLNDFGIYHYWQIAVMTKDDIAKVDEELDFKGRIERDDWIKQGKALAKAKG
jgi:small subunit ribosomal protein S2